MLPIHFGKFQYREDLVNVAKLKRHVKILFFFILSKINFNDNGCYLYGHLRVDTFFF